MNDPLLSNKMTHRSIGAALGASARSRVKPDDPPLVSILITTYNMAAFVNETIESAVSQDYPNLEIVLADDGSTDGTAEINLEYATRYPGKVIPIADGPNQGFAVNANRALGASKGKYIVLQDGDDVLLPGKISAQVEWMEADERRNLCGHDAEVFFEDEDKPPYLHSKTCRLRSGKGAADMVRYGGVFAATSIMLRRSAMPAVEVDERLRNVCNWLLWIECLASGGLFGYVEGVYSRYRKRRSSMSDPLGAGYQRFVEDVFTTLALVEARYAHLAGACKIARAEQLFQKGVVHLLRGERDIARAYMLSGLRQRWFVTWKAPMWLLLTFFPDRWIETIKQTRRRIKTRFEAVGRMF